MNIEDISLSSKEHYETEGFVVLRSVLKELAPSYQSRINISIKEMALSIGIPEDKYLSSVSRWDSPCKIVEVLKDEASKLLMPAVSAILQSNVEPVRASIIQKSALARKGTHGHQDSGYWVLNDSETYDITTWIALDDIDETNGALIVLPQSHKNGPEAQQDFLASDFCDPAKFWGDCGKTLSMATGDVAIFSPDLWHASQPCISDKRRTALVLRWRTIPSLPRLNIPNLLSRHNETTKFGMSNSGSLLKQALQGLVGNAGLQASGDFIELADLVIERQLADSLPNSKKAYAVLEKVKVLTLAKSHGGNDLGHGIWEEVRDYLVKPYLFQMDITI